MKRAAQIDPVKIPLPEGQVLANGSVMVFLRTLAELDKFWHENKAHLPYACEGLDTGTSAMFMEGYQWIFGPTKLAVMETVLRIGSSGITATFFDWKSHDPEGREGFFADRKHHRDHKIEQGEWSNEDETQWQADAARRSPDNYVGWWEICNIPDGMDQANWFETKSSREELIDPSMPLSQVVSTLFEQTFDDWKSLDWEVQSHDADSIDAMIAYWKAEQAKGEDYYGFENEQNHVGA